MGLSPERTENEDGDRFVNDFLFGADGIRKENDGLSASVVMGAHTEGWAGIPHGGIGMGAVTEMALQLNPSADSPYPFDAGFRLGGTSARIMDTFHFRVERTQEREEIVRGAIHVNSESLPYLKAELRFGTEIERPEPPQFLMPVLTPDSDRLKPLPFYKHCFVCGTERRLPGLKRRFLLRETDSGEKVVIAGAGFETGDAESFFAFKRTDRVHPVALMTLLDETLGWGGFMLAGSGGVTVRIDFQFFREVAMGEKIIFYGRGERLRGRIGARLLFWASGGAAVVKEGGGLETVATATGQWMGVPELTRQMHETLTPPELTRDAFRQAKGV